MGIRKELNVLTIIIQLHKVSKHERMKSRALCLPEEHPTEPIISLGGTKRLYEM